MTASTRLAIATEGFRGGGETVSTGPVNVYGNLEVSLDAGINVDLQTNLFVKVEKPNLEISDGNNKSSVITTRNRIRIR